VVNEIHVEHGQLVSRGEKLVTLSDPQLDEQIVTLAGQRAVRLQRQQRWTRAIVSADTRADDRDQTWQNEQQLATAEIRSLDEQLALLNELRDSLVVHADRDGTVDAWRLVQRLGDRPLRRGDHLMHVVADDSPWLVDARVPQKRVGKIASAMERSMTVCVALASHPDFRREATLVRIGPSVVDRQTGRAATTAVLRLEHDAFDAMTAFRDTNAQKGSPARVVFRCGTAPAASLLFQDVIRSLRSFAALYLRWPDRSGEMQQ
jgi:hypothetical protein